ncbi:hypothetical protein K7W42_19180 [Deinococcus sp. HMF7604]|uniref:hypothetical protein n=1 Tax=Deinococcus betulae TaxID=2873312 RepID=UPI001CCB43C0|nr:hypothetical protein [Deinococcus betulae]MBZ9752964.1 hypothetical protein [Deinococcus betulae]
MKPSRLTLPTALTPVEVRALQGVAPFTTRPLVGLQVPEFACEADRAVFSAALRTLRERPF